MDAQEYAAPMKPGRGIIQMRARTSIEEDEKTGKKSYYCA